MARAGTARPSTQTSSLRSSGGLPWCRHACWTGREGRVLRISSRRLVEIEEGVKKGGLVTHQRRGQAVAIQNGAIERIVSGP